MSTKEPFTIEQFYKFLKQQKLMAGKCLNCGKIHLPPRPLCDNCFSQEFEWVNVSGKGQLLTYTIITCCPTTIPSPNALCSGHCTAGKRLENSRLDSRFNARAIKNRHGVNVRFRFMQHNAGMAAMATILLQTLNALTNNAFFLHLLVAKS